MTPDDGQIIGHRAADVIGRPIRGLNVLPVEPPKLTPVLAAMVGMAIEIEVSCLGGRTENGLKVLPIEPRIEIEVLFVEFQYFLTVFLRASDKRLGHSPYLSGCERENSTSSYHPSAMAENCGVECWLCALACWTETNGVSGNSRHAVRRQPVPQFSTISFDFAAKSDKTASEPPRLNLWDQRTGAQNAIFPSPSICQPRARS